MYGLTIKWALSRLISVKTVEIISSKPFIGYLRYVDVFAFFFLESKESCNLLHLWNILL